jgi:hypothetical protein
MMQRNRQLSAVQWSVVVVMVIVPQLGVYEYEVRFFKYLKL